jgi:hypothetical protein
VPVPHRTFVDHGVRFLGAKRHQAKCEDCGFMGELRRDEESARADADMHAGAPDGMPEPRAA